MSRIFISYRRVDSSGYVVAIYDKLAQKFDSAQIFRDLDTIEPGEDFAQVIEDAVSSCDVLLAIIGPHWLTTSDKSGRRRLDNPNDFVRLEIAAALQRSIRIIPVLVGGADVLLADQLPDDLKSLARRNALEVHDRDFHAHMERLIRAIEKVLSTQVRATHVSPLQTPALPDVSVILPPPFEWCEIPAGKVTLEAGGYVPKGGQTFDVPVFAIAKYPTTNAQFAKFIEAGGYNHNDWWTYEGWKWKESEGWSEPLYWYDELWNESDLPVVGVSWFEAMAFCRWLLENSYRDDNLKKYHYEEYIYTLSLPTEQQWQFAAQGHEGRYYPWGKDWIRNPRNSTGNRTTPVNEHPRGVSPFGVMDMVGNVWQWCLTDSETGGVEIRRTNTERSVRGLSWDLSLSDSPTKARFQSVTYTRNRTFGFCVCANIPYPF